MTAAREAIALPLTFLTVALLGGLRISDRVALLPPPLFALVLSVLLLANTMAAAPDRVRALRSVLVIFGSAFVAKFVVLSALSTPAQGGFTRAMQMLFEGVTLGTVTQDVLHPVSGYVAFFTLMLYLIGLVLLPARGERQRSGPTSAMNSRS